MDQANVKVSFYLKKSEADADGMCPVMARLNIGKYSEAAFSVKLRVPQSMWSSGRASGKSVKAKEINNRLDEIRAMALGVYAELSAVRDGVTAGDGKTQSNTTLGDTHQQTIGSSIRPDRRTHRTRKEYPRPIRQQRFELFATNYAARFRTYRRNVRHSHS